MPKTGVNRPFINNKAREIDNLLYSLGTKLFVFLCAGPRQLSHQAISGAVATYSSSLESYWFDNLGILTKGNLLLSIS